MFLPESATDYQIQFIHSDLMSVPVSLSFQVQTVEQEKIRHKASFLPSLPSAQHGINTLCLHKTSSREMYLFSHSDGPWMIWSTQTHKTWLSDPQRPLQNKQTIWNHHNKLISELCNLPLRKHQSDKIYCKDTERDGLCFVYLKGFWETRTFGKQGCSVQVVPGKKGQKINKNKSDVV